MNKTLLAASSLVAVVATGAIAVSADLPSYGTPRAEPAVAPYPPVFTWTGAYVGLNVGAGLAARDISTVVDDGVGDVAVTRSNLSGAGVVGGGQVGYNYQFGGFRPFGGAGGIVAGIEADFDGSSYKASATTSSDLLANTSRVESGIDHIGSVRGRLGVAYDKALVYGTGGFAFGRTYTNADDGFGDSFHRSAERIGYAVGGGVEYMVTPSIGVRGEYIYYDLFRTTDRFSNVFGGESASKVRNDLSTVRVGMDYKFGALGGIGSGVGSAFRSIPVVGGLGF